MVEITIYNNPKPGIVRSIKAGLAYFPDRTGTKWEAFFDGHLVGVAPDKDQAVRYFNDAALKKERQNNPIGLF